MSSNAESPQTEPADDNYVTYYGLSEDPFALQEDKFFVTAKIEKLLGLLDYITHFSQKLVVVYGPPGSGKTRVLDYFVGRLDETDSCCRIEALALDTATQVLREINSQLGVENEDTKDHTQLAEHLKDYLLDLEADSTTCLILVDNAHLFKKPVLEALCELAANASGALHIVLFGQDALVKKLQSIDTLKHNEQLLYTHRLEPFSIEEIKQCLGELFASVGDADKNPFTEQDYLEIHQRSEGLPGQIRQSASQQMRLAVDRLLMKESKPKWMWVSGALILISSIVLVVAFWGMDEKPPLVISEAKSKGAGQSVNTGKIKRIQRMPKQVESEVAMPLQESGLAESSKGVSEPGPGPENVPAILPPAPPDSAQLEMELADKSEEMPGYDDLQVEEVQLEAADVALKQKEVVALPPISISDNTDDNMRLQPPMPQEDLRPQFSEHERIILEYKPTNYTVQLLGLRSELAIKKIVAELPESERYHYFSKDHQGSPLYVLAYGNFESREAALAASRTLPKRLKPQSAWIRKIGGIQDILVNRGKP